MVSELKSALQDIGASNGFFISVLQKLNLFQLKSSNLGAIDVKINGSVLHEKSSFKMLWLHFSSKLDWIEALTLLSLIQENWSLDFFYEVYFFLKLPFVSINQPYCLAWNFVIPRLVLLAAIWICYRIDKNLLTLVHLCEPDGQKIL